MSDCLQGHSHQWTFLGTHLVAVPWYKRLSLSPVQASVVEECLQTWRQLQALSFPRQHYLLPTDTNLLGLTSTNIQQQRLPTSVCTFGFLAAGREPRSPLKEKRLEWCVPSLYLRMHCALKNPTVDNVSNAWQYSTQTDDRGRTAYVVRLRWVCCEVGVQIRIHAGLNPFSQNHDKQSQRKTVTESNWWHAVQWAPTTCICQLPFRLFDCFVWS